jgi:hypothetical protein
MSEKKPKPAQKKPAPAPKKAAKAKAPARVKKAPAPTVEEPAPPHDPSQPLPRMNDETFVQAYLANGLNATQAYATVHPKAKATTCRSEGPRLLQNPDIAARVAHLSHARAAEFEVDGKELLRHTLAIATADHRALSEYRYLCCRYCHGKDHKYQRTLAEFDRDRVKHERSELEREAKCLLANKAFTPKDFDELGGPGFNEWADPVADCPNCFGRGVGRTVLNDTRTLAPDAAILYAGMKEGKDGIEMRSHDKGKALDMLFRHKGLFEADNAQQAAATSPEALARMAAAMEAGRAAQLQKLSDRRGSGFTGD